jgi:hypothetical protein
MCEGLRVSDDRERADRFIVNAKIGRHPNAVPDDPIVVPEHPIMIPEHPIMRRQAQPGGAKRRAVVA